MSTSFYQLNLIGKSTLAEHTYGLFGSGLSPAERHILIDNLLHSLTDTLHIVVSQWVVTTLLEVAVVSARYRVLYE